MPSPETLWWIGFCSAILTCLLLLVAWRYRHRDVFLRRFFSRPSGPPPITCANCQAGISDLSKTTVTGCWTCPSCGRPHTFVDGQPSTIDL